MDTKTPAVVNSTRAEAIALMSSDSQEFIKRSNASSSSPFTQLWSSRDGMLLMLKFPLSYTEGTGSPGSS